MLPKDNRLNLKTDFRFVAAGKKTEDALVKLYWRLGDNRSPRVGISTSSKVYKKAVDRNRARRLLATSLRPLLSQLPSNINLVFLPKASLIDYNAVNLQKRLEELFDNLNL